MIIHTDLTQRDPPRKRTNRRTTGLRILGVLAGLFVAALLVTWWCLQDGPEVAAPLVAMPSPNTPAYHRVQQDSIGDIVAGVNTP